MTLRTGLKVLLGLALGLPLVQSLLVWVAGLLRAMGDAAAADVIGRINTAAGVLWLVSLVALVVLLAVNAVNEPVVPRDELEEP
jgi:hypothetical protein